MGDSTAAAGSVLPAAREALASLRAAAAGAGGAPAPASTLHLGRVSVPQAAGDVPPLANDPDPDPSEPLRPISACDPAVFQPPFQQSFMDKCLFLRGYGLTKTYRSMLYCTA